VDEMDGKKKPLGNFFKLNALGGKRNDSPNHVPMGKRNNVPGIRGSNSPWEQLP
jgi:hypothetical protein